MKPGERSQMETEREIEEENGAGGYTQRHKYRQAVCGGWNSVTRFGDFSPLKQNLNFFWQYFESLCCIWHSFEPTVTNLV